MHLFVLEYGHQCLSEDSSVDDCTELQLSEDSLNLYTTCAHNCLIMLSLHKCIFHLTSFSAELKSMFWFLVSQSELCS